MTSRPHQPPAAPSSDGQTMTEYAVILTLIVVGVIAVIPLFGTTVVGLWNGVNTALGG